MTILSGPQWEDVCSHTHSPLILTVMTCGTVAACWCQQVNSCVVCRNVIITYCVHWTAFDRMYWLPPPVRSMTYLWCICLSYTQTSICYLPPLTGSFTFVSGVRTIYSLLHASWCPLVSFCCVWLCIFQMLIERINWMVSLYLYCIYIWIYSCNSVVQVLCSGKSKRKS